MIRPSQHTEGASKPSNIGQGIRFFLKSDKEKMSIYRILDQMEEEIQTLQTHEEFIEVKDIIYPDFVILIDEISRDESAVEKLAHFICQGTLVIRQQAYIKEVLQIIKHNGYVDIETNGNKILELQETLVKANQDTVTTNQEAAD